MASRSDVQVFWNFSPRLIFVDAPSVDISVQDLHDTLRDLEQESANLIYPSIISSAGKEDLGGGVAVGITSTLLNARLGFEARKAWTSTGTITTADGYGTTLIDSSATFETDGVEPGSWIVNLTDGSICTTLTVDSQTQLTTDGLGGGTDNDFHVSDSYRVLNVVQVEVDGGNLVAVDGYQSAISSIFPTAGTQAVRTSSSSATSLNQSAIDFASFQNAIWIDVINGTSGTSFPNGTREFPVDNLADAISIANTRKLKTFGVLGNLTVGSSSNVSNFVFKGENTFKTTITVDGTASTDFCEFVDCHVTGTLDGYNTIKDCRISNLAGLHGFIFESQLDPGTITLSGNTQQTVVFDDCYSGIPGEATPTIDCDGYGPSLILRNYSGGVTLQNKTGANDFSLDISQGNIILDSTITDGGISVRGTSTLANNATGSTTVTTKGYIQPSKLLTTSRFLALS